MLHPPYDRLLSIFENSEGKSATFISEQIQLLNLVPTLCEALCLAVKGDNRPLNTWLFNVGKLEGQVIAWIAPVKSPSPKYVWMLGLQNPQSRAVEQWFTSAQPAASLDSFLKQKQVPPPLLFVDPIAISRTIVNQDHEDEFAIFQVGYKDAPVDISDLEQRMVINTPFSVDKRRKAVQRLKASLIDSSDPVIRCLEENLELFSILHNDGHNQGHFTGAWPFEDNIKKNCVLYEAVEEFKACIGAVLLSEHLPLSDLEKDAFALSVVMTRFWGYGYEAYSSSTQRRETAREIAVGLFFFEWLMREQIISLKNTFLGPKVSIDYSQIRNSLRRAYASIYEAETEAMGSVESLRKIASDWYARSFPLQNYSSSATLVYTSLEAERR